VEVASYGPSDGNSSSAFVNNDWKHWVVLHGSEKVAVEDVWGVGRAIGVKFNGDTHNIFSVLSKAGKGVRASESVVMGGRGSSAGR